MNRTFGDASFRGSIKWKLMGSSLSTMNINTDLLTEEEKIKLSVIKTNLSELINRFDLNTAKLGFNVWRYNIIIDDERWSSVSDIKTGITNSEYKWYKKQGFNIKILNKYKL